MPAAIINAEFINRAEAMAEQGYLVKDIYRTLGVGQNTWYKYWGIGRQMAETGESDNDEYKEETKLLCKELFLAVERGRASARMDAIEIIKDAARKKDWKAAAYLLEHLDPDWKKQARQKHDHEVKIVIERQVEQLTSGEE